jgi:hypothetical protein
MFLCPLSLSRKAMLEDIAVLTKGELISEELGVKLESVTLDMLGAGKKKDIQGRIGQIKAQIEETTSDYDKEKLQERLAEERGDRGGALQRQPHDLRRVDDPGLHHVDVIGQYRSFMDAVGSSRVGPEAVGLLSDDRPEEAVDQRACVEWQSSTRTGRSTYRCFVPRTRHSVLGQLGRYYAGASSGIFSVS